MELTKRDNCSDCQVPAGTRHEAFCDWARCKATGVQQVQCEGELHEFKGREYGEHEGECIPSIFTGYYNMELEAAEYGWYTAPDSIWGRMPDLNRVAIECNWDPDLERYVKR
jgi:hypothetical protein